MHEKNMNRSVPLSGLCPAHTEDIALLSPCNVRMQRKYVQFKGSVANVYQWVHEGYPTPGIGCALRAKVRVTVGFRNVDHGALFWESDILVCPVLTRGGHSHMYCSHSYDWGQNILTVIFVA